MSPPLRALCLALACAHVVAATAPCAESDGRIPGAAALTPGASPTPGHDAAGGHGGHEPAHHAPSPDPAKHPVAHAGHGETTQHAGHAEAVHHPGHGEALHHAAAPTTRAHESTPSDEGASWRQPCPCGCDRAPRSETPGRRLDPGLLLAGAPASGAFEPFLSAAAAPAAPRVFPDAPEPVPLPA